MSIGFELLEGSYKNTG